LHSDELLLQAPDVPLKLLAVTFEECFTLL
jgi:hypothetical protein